VKDCEAAEDVLLAGPEQGIAPLDRGTQSSLSSRRIAGARSEHREASVEPDEQVVRVEQGNAGGGKLDCEWKTV
jgi:hypothetical protein